MRLYRDIWGLGFRAWDVPNSRGTFLRGPCNRIIVFGGLCWGSPIWETNLIRYCGIGFAFRVAGGFRVWGTLVFKGSLRFRVGVLRFRAATIPCTPLP